MPGLAESRIETFKLPASEARAPEQQAGPGLLTTLHDWLLRQPWIEIDESDEPATMDWLRASIPSHPAAEQREAARLRRRSAENHGANMAFMRSLRDRLRGRP